MEEATNEQEAERETSDYMHKVAKEYNLDHYTINLWRQVFTALDLDSSGEIHELELQVAMAVVGRKVSTSEIRGLLSSLDQDYSGGVNFPEFLKFMLVQEDQFQEYQNKKSSANIVNRHVSRVMPIKDEAFEDEDHGDGVQEQAEDRALFFIDSIAGHAQESQQQITKRVTLLMKDAVNAQNSNEFIAFAKKIDMELNFLLGKERVIPKNQKVNLNCF